eukprot:750711-Rhodomonas_salina.3
MIALSSAAAHPSPSPIAARACCTAIVATRRSIGCICASILHRRTGWWVPRTREVERGVGLTERSACWGRRRARVRGGRGREGGGREGCQERG